MAEGVCFDMFGLQFDVPQNQQLASITDIPIGEIWAGLVLSQDCIPEEHCANRSHANRTHISHFKEYIDSPTLFSACLYQLWTNKPLQYISTPYNIHTYTRTFLCSVFIYLIIMY